MPVEAKTVAEQSIRVVSVYATRWTYSGEFAAGPEGYFELGKLSEYYALFADQMPQVLVHRRLVPDDVPIEVSPGLGAVEAWLFALPSDQVVAAITLEFDGTHPNVDPAPTVAVLEACAYGSLRVRGMSLSEYVAGLAVDAGVIPPGTAADNLPPERHQLVFARRIPSGPPDPEKVWRVLYRVDPPYLKQFMHEVQPSGLNQEGRVFGWITPYVSLLYGHQRYVEDSVFLSTVQAIGTAARFRQIWRDAYEDVRRFRKEKLAAEVGLQSRDSLEELVDRLGNLELDLSFSVETSADMGLLIPSLRIESFHRALYEVLELPTRAQTVSRMFARLDSSIRSEITAIEIRERRAEEAQRRLDEERRRVEEERRVRRDAAAAAVLSVGAVPISFLLGFFGINTSQVTDHDSVFDLAHYWWVYVLAGVLGTLPVVVFTYMHGLASLKSLFSRRPRHLA